MEPWNLEPARDLGMSSVDRFRSLSRESGLVSSATHLACWTMIRGYMKVWHRIAIEGRENLPVKPPFILVANHTSHLDALALASHLPWKQRDRIFPIAAGDVFFHTSVRSAFSAGMLNALPMWRKHCGPHALENLRRRLVEEPCAYILFPEGARSRDGKMLSFKQGLGMLVAQTEVPVVPCHLRGCDTSMHASHRWPRPGRIRLRIGKPLSFADVAKNREGWIEIASKTEEQVRLLGEG